MKKVRTNSILSNLFFIFILLTTFTTMIILPIGEIYNYLFLFIVLLIILVRFFPFKEKHLKEIIIEEEYIELIYKKKNPFSFNYEHEKIVKSDIRKFNVAIEKIEANLLRAKYIYQTTIKISRHNNPTIILDINRRAGSPYYTFLESLKYSKNIPNFSFETKGLHSFEKEEIDYLLKTGKRKINFIFLGIVIFLITLLILEISLLFLNIL